MDAGIKKKDILEVKNDPISSSDSGLMNLVNNATNKNSIPSNVPGIKRPGMSKRIPIAMLSPRT